ncbi:MAG: prepilin-type N-terminal cleavage/methylation domain-containing protein [Ruthenibacterium sp.]
MKRERRGFTLIELIVVLAILAIVAAIAVPLAFGSLDKAKLAADKASLESVNSAIRTQAALCLLDDKDSANSVKAALIAGGFCRTGKKDEQGAFHFQSDVVYVAWHVPTATHCGYFTLSRTGQETMVPPVVVIYPNETVPSELIWIAEQAKNSTIVVKG